MRQKKRDKINEPTQSASGSVLLLALILTAILLSIGMGISEIAMKEIKLSSIGDESGAAFYAADGGAECALLWDIQRPYSLINGTFATSSDSINFNLIPSQKGKPIYCPSSTFDIATQGDPSSQGGPVPTNPPSPAWAIQLASDASYAYATTTFIVPIDSSNFLFGDQSQPCAVVAVGKKTSLTTAVTYTTIESYGRSSCDTNPRRVERGLKVSY